VTGSNGRAYKDNKINIMVDGGGCAGESSLGQAHTLHPADV